MGIFNIMEKNESSFEILYLCVVPAIESTFNNFLDTIKARSSFLWPVKLIEAKIIVIKIRIFLKIKLDLIWFKFNKFI